MDAVEQALLVELARRTAVCWVRVGGRSTLVWHAWHEDALCLVVGGEEQPLPGLPVPPEEADGSPVEVVMRSKDTGGRQLTWVGRVHVVPPEDEHWPGTTAALVAARLNLRDPATAPRRWASGSTVLRLLPPIRQRAPHGEAARFR